MEALDRLIETEKLDEKLDPLSDEEIAQLSKCWMQPALHAIFEHPNLKGHLHRIGKTLAGSKLSGISGSGWGYLDAISGYTNAYYDYQKLKEKPGSNKVKKACIAIDTTLSTFIIGSGVVLTVAQLASLGAGMASVMVLSAGGAFAAICWGMCAASIVELMRTVRKFKDPKYLFRAKLKRFEETSNEQDQEAIKQQLISLFRVHNEKGKKQKIPIPDFNEHPLLDDNFQEAIKQPPNDHDRALVALIESKQRDKVITRSISTAQWIIAAVAMTCFALAPVCPYLLIPAFVLAGVAMAIRIGQMAASKIGNYLARKQMMNDIDPNLMTASKEPEALIEIAYQINQQYNPDEKINEQQFKQSIGSMSNWRRKRYLKGAFERHVDDLILDRMFDNKANTSITKGERRKIVDQYCRNEYRLKQHREDYQFTPVEQSHLHM